MTPGDWLKVGIAIGLIVVFVIVRDRLRMIRQRRARLEALWGNLPDREFEEGDLTRISLFFRNRVKETFTIDDITWNDLEMDEVFRRLDYCRTSVGEEWLYNALRSPEFSDELLEKRRGIAEFFRKDRAFALGLQENLLKIGRSRRRSVYEYLTFLFDQGKAPVLVHVLCILMVIFGILSFIWLPDSAILILVVAVCVSLLLYHQTRSRVEAGFFCMRYLARLISICRKIAHKPFSGSAAGIADDMRVQCGKLARIGEFSPVLRGTGNAVDNPLDVIWDYLAMIFHVDLLAYSLLLASLQKNREAAEKLFADLGELELGLCSAMWQESAQALCVPELSDGKKPFLEADGLVHPLLADAVPNGIRTVKPVLLTGSNASGKSTFLKTTAMAAVLAQTMGLVPARSYRAPYAAVMSSMALRDSVVGGESYFMVELRSLKRILEAETPGVLFCFVDEVLRGTNTVERIAASSEILRVLAGSGVLCFAATHDGELTGLLAPWYDNYHFEETVEDGDVRFSYELKDGPAVSRNAIELLRIFGYGESIVQHARRTAEAFEATGTWRMT